MIFHTNKQVKYLLRFDDICPTMDWKTWDKIEESLDRFGIKPILAVIPDNKDTSLMIDKANPNFWDRVREWQDKGWCIGIHGLNHLYVTKSPGLMKINSRSEFAGLEYGEQASKIKLSIQYFKDNGVTPDLWIAPSHSFDSLTLKALKANGINIISDGFYSRLVNREDIIWIPQQLWRFRKMRFGIWTVCYHHNTFNKSIETAFYLDIEKYHKNISTVSQVLKSDNSFQYGAYDRILSKFWTSTLALKQLLR